MYFLFELNYSAVSIGTGATSYKRLVQVSPIFSAFTESFLELLRVYSYSVVPLAYCYNVYVAGCKSTACKVNLRTRKTRTYLSLSRCNQVCMIKHLSVLQEALLRGVQLEFNLKNSTKWIFKFYKTNTTPYIWMTS